MRYREHHSQPALPFVDLPNPEKDSISELKDNRPYKKRTNRSIASILTQKDCNLLFMTMAVSMTATNEMPIVRPYTGPIPSDIRGINRVAPREMFHVAPHFFFEDARIMQYWNKPFKTAELLSNFAVSIGIDFSMTNEMTRPQKMYASFLNKLWVAWLQSRGHQVIPNVSFPDEWQNDYWIEGWPKNSIIAVSSVGLLRHGNPKEWNKAVDRIRMELQPSHILRYGPIVPGENHSGCSYFANDNTRSAYGR